ncbi:hypothetical protein BJ986_002394 [Phycicoccus badiiscoriae]|uniref:Uncharacterized protein n=1 Tax=Pedococcus badiiscoriae TaxID=642776 RepID=A0A852WFA1_9MICO|nr:hypothetical protein [Pedococcus badiiscoriae]
MGETVSVQLTDAACPGREIDHEGCPLSARATIVRVQIAWAATVMTTTVPA